MYIYIRIYVYIPRVRYLRKPRTILSLFAFSNGLFTPVGYGQTRLSLISSLNINRLSKRIPISFNDQFGPKEIASSQHVAKSKTPVSGCCREQFCAKNPSRYV